ncbi:mannose-6-phosphate isomerase [Tenuifilaceae bacterium CYCD]|nr:mannose-6-phosphate isomerase [Tenuifilaceae bacterium CYCD]
MNEGLYPLKFKPQFKERIWGGNRLRKELTKAVPREIDKCGESWEISAVQDSVSVVSNGYLAGNDLQELIEVYMGELVGDSVYEEFGVEFPLLIKLIDAQDVLSIQVHPDDETAKRVHHAYGKTEMWYVISADENAEIITGFKRDITREEYLQSLSDGLLKELLNVERVKVGDVFFIPAGRVHAIGKGVMLAEIQQTSDITYRIYDWDRVDSNGKSRDLHNDLAIDVIDFKAVKDPKWTRPNVNNKTAELINCEYFTVNRLSFTESIKRDYNALDSFVIFMCLQGEASIIYGNGAAEKISIGETVLLPADIKDVILRPAEKCSILEIFKK